MIQFDSKEARNARLGDDKLIVIRLAIDEVQGAPKVGIKSDINIFNQFVQCANFQHILQVPEVPKKYYDQITIKSTNKCQKYAQSLC